MTARLGLFVGFAMAVLAGCQSTSDAPIDRNAANALSAGLADAIGRLSADSERAESIGRKARDRYEEAHRPAVTAEQTLGLIEEVRIAARGGH